MLEKALRAPRSRHRGPAVLVLPARCRVARSSPGDTGSWPMESHPGGKRSSATSPAPSACRINTSGSDGDTRDGVLKDNINKLGRAVSRLRRGLASRRSLSRGDHDH